MLQLDGVITNDLAAPMNILFAYLGLTHLPPKIDKFLEKSQYVQQITPLQGILSVKIYRFSD